MDHSSPSPEQSPISPLPDDERTREIADDANALLDYPRQQENNLTPKTPIQRTRDVAGAIAASEALHDQGAIIAGADRAVRQAAADRIVPEADLERRMPRDELTGLPSQSAFRQADLHHLDDPQTRFVIMDANSFKPVNDIFGHPAGDAALKFIAEVIASLSEEPEFERSQGYRIGGDEFAVVLPAAQSGDFAQRALEAFGSKLIQAGGISYNEGRDHITTEDLLEIGFGLTIADGATYEQADAAMMKLKRESNAAR